ncbi:vacuolar membrane protein [Lactarius hatsudake]|nr:vacuolar membrane protein [Lactarius hatsudake]
MSEPDRDLPLEMDTLPAASSPVTKATTPVGICLLLVVVFLWTGSNFVTQDLFVGGYGKPFLITYLTTSSFSLYLVPFLIRSYVRRHQGDSNQSDRSGPPDEYEPLMNEDETLRGTSPHRRSLYVPPEPTPATLPPLTTRETAQLASAFCFLWFLANWSLNAGLGLTSVASATILSSMSGFFTLILGRIFRIDNFTIAKIGAVATSFTGVILVSLSDTGAPAPTSSGLPVLLSALRNGRLSLLGDCLALLSALFYAFYVILLKVRIRSESRIDMQLFFGFVGLFNILACWPIGVVLHFTGVERFELPASGRAVAGLLVNMAITLSSDYIYVLAMLKTTPLVVTIGLSLTMPLAVLGDIILQHPVKAQVVVGAALVLLSFVVIGLEDGKTPPGPEIGDDDRL